jgi:hypothetical protein
VITKLTVRSNLSHIVFVVVQGHNGDVGSVLGGVVASSLRVFSSLQLRRYPRPHVVVGVVLQPRWGAGVRRHHCGVCSHYKYSQYITMITVELGFRRVVIVLVHNVDA